MKNFMLSIFCVFFLAACAGGKKATNTNFELQAAALLSGASAGAFGGIALTGSNGSDKFSVGLTYEQAQSFSLELPAGDWTFHAIAWLGQSDGNGNYLPMSGESRCGSSVTTIQGDEVNVTLTLTAPNCGTPTFSQSNAMDPQEPVGTFNKVELNSCLNISTATSPGDICQGVHGNAYMMAGESLSARLVLVGQSNFGASLSSLVSKCSSIDKNNPPYMFSGLIQTEVRLPVGGSVAFPLAIRAYEALGCDEESDISVYPMPDGIAGTQGVARQYYPAAPGKTRVKFADNFIGGATSVFALSGGPNLPSLLCMNNCYGASTTINNSNSLEGHQRDRLRDTVWDIVGTMDGFNPHEKEVGETGAVYAMGTVINAGRSLHFMAAQIGYQGNQINVQFLSDTALHVYCSNEPPFIQIFVPSEISANDIAMAVNSQCSHIATATASGTGVTDPITSWDMMPGFNLSNGKDPDQIIVPRTRKEGQYNRIRRILLGAVGVILYQNGINDSVKLCTQNGHFPLHVPGKGQIVAKLSNASALAEFPSFAPDNDTFQRKLVLSKNGVDDEAFYFNCESTSNNSDAPDFWSYVSMEQDGGDVRQEQVFWRLNATGQGIIETNSKNSYAENESRSYSKFQLVDSDTWYLWSLQAHDGMHGEHYGKYVAKRMSSEMYGYLEDDNAPFSPDFSSSNEWLARWTIADGTYLGSASGSTPAPPEAPSIMDSYSVEELMSPSFWSFSY